MKIAFPCPHCGTKLAVDDSFAGRSGRCHACNRRMVVPAKGELPLLAPRGGPAARPAAQGQPAARPKPAASGDDAAPYRLAAIDDAPAARGTASLPAGTSPRPAPVQAPAPLQAPASVPDDPFGVADEEEFVVSRGAPMAPVAPPSAPDEALRAYRNVVGFLVRTSTWIAETSYTVSFLLLILGIASGMTGAHAVASLCVAAIVVFNVVGLVGDLASLVTLSFRKSPLQGALFLVPPFTFWYLWTDWQRYREAAGRLRIPLVMLAVVAAAHLTVPWLGGGNEAARAVGADVEGVVDGALGSAEDAAALGGDAVEPARGAIHRFREALRDWTRRNVHDVGDGGVDPGAATGEPGEPAGAPAR